MIRDGQRIAVLAIARFELAFEVSRPHLIWRVGMEGGCARVCPLSSPSIFVQKPVPLEERVQRTPSWPHAIGVPCSKDLQQLLGAPPILPSCGHNEGFELSGRPVRALMRSPALIREPRVATDPMAGDPFVPRRACHAIPLAELGH